MRVLSVIKTERGVMNRQKTPHQTAIVLLDKKSADNVFIKDWFEKSPFMTNEIANIFQVLEDISDFTVRSRPDIILVEVDSLQQDFVTIQRMIDFLAGEKNFPIFALSESGKVVNDTECFEGNLAEVRAQIEKLNAKSTALNA
jgi:hypothetical protein